MDEKREIRLQDLRQLKIGRGGWVPVLGTHTRVCYRTKMRSLLQCPFSGSQSRGLMKEGYVVRGKSCNPPIVVV